MSIKGHTYAREGDELRGQVEFYRGGLPILSLDTAEQAVLKGSFPEVGKTIRVKVQTADNPYERMGRRSRYIVVVEIEEPKPTEQVWRASDSQATGPRSTIVHRADGSSVPVEYKRRRVPARSTAA